MNIKTIINQLALPVSVILLSGSCNKQFLDQRNPQTIDLKTAIVDLPSMASATTGVYNQFQGSGYYSRTFTLLPDLIGDNVYISVKNAGRYSAADNFTIGTGDGYVLGVWSAAYKAIVNANLAISEGEQITFSAADQPAANQLIGEMYACRAWAHFDLVRFFAQPYNFTADASHDGVPLIIKPNDEIISPPRATVGKVYEQIELDLLKAEELMSLTKKDGRFSKSVAQALLAKVYLYMERWQDAERYATKVIDGGLYSLLTTADYVDSWAAAFTTESILQVINTPTDNPGSESLGYLYEQAGYGEALATKDIYDTYTATDVRRSLLTPGNRVGGEVNTYFVRKYPNGFLTKDDDMRVLRLSEIYLIRAEALAEQGKADPGKIAGAQADVTLIAQYRDPNVSPILATGDDLVKRIILERRKELAFEGNRLFDLNRKKMDVNHIQSDRTQLFTYPNNRFIMPIPYTERSANPNIGQNPGWFD